MKQARGAASNEKAKAAATTKVPPISKPGAASAPTPKVAPLRPRRGLLIVMSLIFAMWIGLLVVLYLKDVYPRRHTGPQGATTEKAVSSGR